MVKIFKNGLPEQGTIAVFYDVQPFQDLYDDRPFRSLSCYLSHQASRYFLASLSDEQRERLNEAGCLVANREQFAWLPIEANDGVPEHERKNMYEFIAQQQVSK